MFQYGDNKSRHSILRAFWHIELNNNFGLVYRCGKKESQRNGTTQFQLQLYGCLSFGW